MENGKNGYVTKSQKHTISILSWQESAQFHFMGFREKSHVSLGRVSRKLRTRKHRS